MIRPIETFFIVSPRRRRVALNRLAFVHGPKVLSLTAAMWLLSAPNASSQFALPDGTDAGAPSATQPAPAVTSTLASGQRWIDHARQAIGRKDYQSAVTSYREAAALGPKAPQLASEIAKLRLDLQVAGIDSQLLKISPPAAKPSFATPPAIPSYAIPAQKTNRQV